MDPPHLPLGSFDLGLSETLNSLWLAGTPFMQPIQTTDIDAFTPYKGATNGALGHVRLHSST